MSTVFLAPAPNEAETAWREERTRSQRVTVAVEAEQVVASFRSFDTPLSLPGGTSAPTNAISGVVVLPTHRRRNLLRRWMIDELRRAHDAGSVASILIASEAPIYGRYGFGVATTDAPWTIDATRARLTVERTGSVQLVDGATFAEHAPEVYQLVADRRAGAIGRTDHYYRYIGQLVEGLQDTDKRRSFVLHRDDAGRVDGVMAYSIKEDWDNWISKASLSVVDLLAADDAAEAALFQFACDVDFVTTVKLDLPPGHHLPWLLTDGRTARSGPIGDQLWARIHDVEAALSARRYALPGQLVIEVDDPDDQAGGRYLLEVDDSGVGRCTRTDGQSGAGADIHLRVNDLAGLWLGGGETTPTVATLVSIGRAKVRDEATAARAHALFSWPVAPWAATPF